MARTLPQAACALLALLLLGAAGAVPPRFLPAPPAWRVLIYVAADNDLEPAAMRLLEQIAESERPGPPAGSTVALQIDRSPAMAAARTRGAWHDTRRYLDDGRGLHAVAELGRQDSASAAVVRDFLRWGLAATQGEHTLLVLWSHGWGERALLDDESSGSRLPVDELVALLREVPIPIDLLFLDACSMQTLEVAQALAHPQVARWLVATESLQDADAWPYRELLTLLATRPALPPEEVAQWLARHAGTQAGAFTLSVLDLPRVPALVEATAKLRRGLQQLDLRGRRAAAARLSALRFTTRELGAVDLGAAMWALQPLLPEIIGAAQRAYAATVLVSVHGRDFDDATGLAVRQRLFLDATAEAAP